MENRNKEVVIYACSGCSDAGELADRTARELSRSGEGQMSCLAGIGGRVKSLMAKAEKAERIIVIDGCPLNCARHTMLNAGFSRFEHLSLSDAGLRKGQCPVSDATAGIALSFARQAIADAAAKRSSEQGAAVNCEGAAL